MIKCKQKDLDSIVLSKFWVTWQLSFYTASNSVTELDLKEKNQITGIDCVRYSRVKGNFSQNDLTEIENKTEEAADH